MYPGSLMFKVLGLLKYNVWDQQDYYIYILYILLYDQNNLIRIWHIYRFCSVVSYLSLTMH